MYQNASKEYIVNVVMKFLRVSSTNLSGNLYAKKGINPILLSSDCGSATLLNTYNELFKD